MSHGLRECNRRSGLCSGGHGWGGDGGDGTTDRSTAGCCWSASGGGCGYESDGGGDVGADTWVLGHEFGADAGEVGECGGELGLRGGPRCHAGLDLRGEVGVLAHAFDVAVGAAAGGGDPGVEATGKDVGAVAGLRDGWDCGGGGGDWCWSSSLESRGGCGGAACADGAG